MTSQGENYVAAAPEASGMQRTGNWGEALIQGILYPFASFAAPAFLLALLIYFIWQGFTEGLSSGLRSFAAALLPLMVVTYLTTTRRAELSHRTANIPTWVTFTLMLVVGAALMPLASLSGSLPIAELVLSGCFSVLVGEYVLLRDQDRQKAMSYYFGLILGVLGSVVVVGLPHL